jgi:hypothetical protein
LHCLDRSDEALAAVGRAVELDPLRALFQVDANFPLSRRVLGEACSVLGRHEEGIDLIEKTQPILPKGNFCVGFLALAYLRAGRRADAERMRADLEEAARHQFIPSATLALVAAALGDSGSAFARIEESIRERDPNIGLSIRSAYFQSLHSDPRYEQLIRSMNLFP